MEQTFTPQQMSQMGQGTEVNTSGVGRTFSPQEMQKLMTMPTTDTSSSLNAGDIVNSVGRGIYNYGKDVVQGTVNSAKDAFSGLTKDVNDISDTEAKQQTEGTSFLKQIPQDIGSIYRTGIGTISDLAKLVLSPISGLTDATVKNASDLISEGKGTQAIATGPVGDAMEKAQKGLSDWSEQNPKASKALMDTLNVALIGAGGNEVKGDIAQTGADANAIKEGVASAASTLKNKVGETVNAIKEPFTYTPPTQADIETSAIKDATPSYSKNAIGEPQVKDANGTMKPRVNEGGIIKGRTINSTDSEIEAGRELAKTKSYNPNGTSLEKFNAVQSEIASRGSALEQSLKDENVLRPPKELNKIVKNAVNTASEDSLLLQKTDPIVRNYVRVANRAITQADGTLEGELNVRKALDNAYEDAGGKYGNNKGLDQIHRAARNALNDDMEAKSQNTEVKASLKEQSNLYKASDVLQDKARAEGGSAYERFRKAHPIANKIIEKGASTIGLGGVVDVASH